MELPFLVFLGIHVKCTKPTKHVTAVEWTVLMEKSINK